MSAIVVHLSDADVARIQEAVARRVLELLQQHPGRSEPCEAQTHATVREAAKRLRRSTRWIRHLISIGRLQVTRVGDGPRPRLLVPLSAIDKLLAESTI